MKLTRRNFVITTPLALGLLKFGGSIFGQKARGGFKIPSLAGDRLAQLNWDSFLPYQYSDFIFSKGAEAYKLKLVDIVDTAPSGFVGKKEHPCFELHFEANFVTPIPADTYRVEHFALGEFDLFITPGGRKGGSSYAVAIINRLLG